MRDLPSREQIRIAMALEKLAAKAIADVAFGMNVLKLPPSVRAPIWEAVARRAIVKVIECERASSP